MKKIKGEAIIKLKNAKTGKIEYQKKHNLVTNLPNIATSYIPFGFGNFCPSLIDLTGGMLLFSDTNTEDVDGHKLSQLPVGWSGIDINSIADCGKGYLVTSECDYDEKSVTITHEWGTSQANGTISSISLTNPVGCIKSEYLKDSCFWTYGPSKVVNEINGSRSIRNQLGVTSNRLGHILHIDVDNGVFYEMTNDSSYQTLYFKKIKRNVKKILLGEATHAEYYNIKGGLNGVFSGVNSTELESKNIQLTNALNWNDDGYLTNSFHFDVTNDILYIFSLYQNQKVKITKISNIIEGNLQETTSEIDLSNIFSANSVLGSGIFYRCRHLGSTISQNKILIKDAIAFKDNYLYLQTTGVKILKVNITDLSDYRILDLPFLFYNTGAEGAFINDGNLFYGKSAKYSINYSTPKCTVIINMTNDEIRVTEDSVSNANFCSTYNGTTGGMLANNNYSNNEFCKINDAWFLEYNAQFSGDGSDYDSASVALVLNPAYLATINNVSPFLKTSAQTLTITYKLTEIDEVEENNEIEGNE